MKNAIRPKIEDQDYEKRIIDGTSFVENDEVLLNPDVEKVYCVNNERKNFDGTIGIIRTRYGTKYTVVSSAYVKGTIYVGNNVKIGAGAAIYPNVWLKDGAIIDSRTTVMNGSVIGEKTIIYADCTICRRCVIGKKCKIYAYSIIENRTRLSDGLMIYSFSRIYSNDNNRQHIETIAP